MKKEMLVTLSMVIMALVICFSVSPVAVRADSSDGQSKYPVYTYTKDGETISTWVYEGEDKEVDGEFYIEGQIRIKGPKGIYFLDCANPLCYGFDKYGTIWLIRSDENSIYGWNYYLQNNEDLVHTNIMHYGEEIVFDAASLVLDENNEYVVGYKTFSGDVYPLLSYEDIAKKVEERAKENFTPTPTPTAPSTPKPTPSSPSKPVTPVNPGVTTPVPTVPVVTPNVTPNVTPDVTTNPKTSPNAPQKLSIKKQKSKISLYVGSKLMSSYGLKKGTLTWNVGKKTGKVKKVKAVGYIKKSKNLIYITKNGKAYIISSKGKKKVILKKGARKLVFKGGFVTKVNKKSGSLNVTGK